MSDQERSASGISEMLFPTCRYDIHGQKYIVDSFEKLEDLSLFRDAVFDILDKSGNYDKLMEIVNRYLQLKNGALLYGSADVDKKE